MFHCTKSRVFKLIAANRLKERTEWQVFFQRNRIHIFLTTICIILCVKQSSAPFLWEYNLLTRFLFEIAEGPSVTASVVSILYNLGLAYLSSLLFYLVVDYFPKRRKERTAEGLIVDRIERIDHFISQLFSYLMFFVGVGSDLSQLKPESFSKLRGIPLQDKLHYCHTQDIIEQTGEIVEEGNPDCVNEFYSVKESLLHRYDRDDRICTERQKRCAVERFGPRAALRICR